MEFPAVDLEWRHDLDLVPMRAEPLGVARAAAAERKVEPDDPGLDVHDGRQPVDELLWRQRRQLAVETQHDSMLNAGGLDEAKLLAQRRDRRRAVGRIEDAARVWLECDEGGLSMVGGGGVLQVPDH